MRQDARKKSPKNRSGATDTGSEGLGVSGENHVLGQRSAFGATPLSSPVIYPYQSPDTSRVYGTNGAHDRADVAGLLMDPDKVCSLLTEFGWKIAFESSLDLDGHGCYVNPETWEELDASAVEAAYRHALTGLAGRRA